MALTDLSSVVTHTLEFNFIEFYQLFVDLAQLVQPDPPLVNYFKHP